MEKYKLESFELIDLCRRGLQPYDPISGEPHPKKKERPTLSPPFFRSSDEMEEYEHLYDIIKNDPDRIAFKSIELEAFEKKHPELLEEDKTKPQDEKDKTTGQRLAEQEKTIFPCTLGTRWGDITITLVANNMVRIKTPQGEGRFTYHQLGMQDERAGDKPTMLWELLKLFAKNSGFISSQNPNYDPKLPDTTKRLNKHLKEFFGINETIYTGHYKKEKGYRTKIKFYDYTY